MHDGVSKYLFLSAGVPCMRGWPSALRGLRRKSWDNQNDRRRHKREAQKVKNQAKHLARPEHPRLPLFCEVLERVCSENNRWQISDTAKCGKWMGRGRCMLRSHGCSLQPGPVSTEAPPGPACSSTLFCQRPRGAGRQDLRTRLGAGLEGLPNSTPPTPPALGEPNLSQ